MRNPSPIRLRHLSPELKAAILGHVCAGELESGY